MTAVPSVYTSFLSQVAPRLRIPDSAAALMGAYSSRDVKASMVAQVIGQNQYLEYQFLKVIESISKREQQPSVEAAVVLYGMLNSRNVLIALQLKRRVRGGHPEFGGDGKLTLKPPEVLKFALKAEEAVVSDPNGNPDLAFAAGAVFDMLAMIVPDLGDAAKGALGQLESAFVHGLRTAKIASELGGQLKDLMYKKYAFSAGLLHDLGKVALGMLSPDYPKFLDEMSKRELPRAIRHHIEGTRFGIHHGVLSGMIAQASGVFREIAPALTHHHEPYVLRRINRNHHELSALVSLATCMASHFRKVEKTEDQAFDKWLGPELEGFRIDRKQIQAVTAKVLL